MKMGTEEASEVLDLSQNKIKKLSKCSTEHSHITSLILDDNELSRLDSLDSYQKLQKLSIVRNQLLRMHGVCRLLNLQYLNLAHNGILTIEGLKDLVNLKWLCLAGNSLKTIEHLSTNINLEHLDLSENNITHINDLSLLKNLQELYLHNNKIHHLRQGERFLPSSLTTLTLANNNIEDLNEISQLVHLNNLQSISIANNPCVNMSNNSTGFDYRPFVINWCLNIKNIDGYAVDAIESLRAEWLYSQGRGRHFRVGDQKDLVQYLAGVCPLSGEAALQGEEGKKLRLILSKAQQHQQQLREQSYNSSPIPSPASRKKISAKNSPRINNLRKIKSPDQIMSTSCYNNSNNSMETSLMTQSLDPTILQNVANCEQEPIVNSPLQAFTKMMPVPESLMSPEFKPTPIVEKIGGVINQKIAKTQSPKMKNKRKTTTTTTIQTAEKKSATPSPLSQRKSSIKSTAPLRKSPSSEEESLCESKLQTINLRAEEKKMQKGAEIVLSEDKVEEQAAIFIQKMWRGYFTRNKNKHVQDMFRGLQTQRANQYIEQLTNDMETTKAALESERKIQMLQTEAISALWKQMSALQPSAASQTTSAALNMTNLSAENSDVVKELSRTCSVLQNQIQQLQNSMQDIVKVMTCLTSSTHNNNQKAGGTATQTEIIAVHTPQGDGAKLFPFNKFHTTQTQTTTTRPSSLPLPVNHKNRTTTTTTTQQSTGNTELKQYAGHLVEDAIKHLSDENQEINEENKTNEEDDDDDGIDEENVHID